MWMAKGVCMDMGVCMCMCMHMSMREDASAGVNADASVGVSPEGTGTRVYLVMRGHGWQAVAGGRGSRPARGGRERRDGGVWCRTSDLREDGEPVRVLARSAWHIRSAAAVGGGTAAPVFPHCLHRFECGRGWWK